jgi:hypothetical protein
VSDQGIFIFAVIVFGLMVIGLVLTIMEFRASVADLSSAVRVEPDNTP